MFRLFKKARPSQQILAEPQPLFIESKSEQPPRKLLPPPVLPSELEWEQCQPPAEDAKVEVIIPIYGDYVKTARCLFSVLTSNNNTPYNLVAINDASPDQKITDLLRRLQKRKLITLIENNMNQGFVVSANMGIAHSPARDIILLNSDTEVFGDWIDRLYEIANQHPKIATVTPLSNNAELASYPVVFQNNNFALETSPQSIDQMASTANKQKWIKIPTAVGFCMFIKRSAIERVGTFDAQTFKDGYGEENDFSMRATQKGLIHALACNVYVLHYGQASFGERKTTLLRQGLSALRAKHPHYNSLIQDHVNKEPTHEAFKKLDLLRLKNYLMGHPTVFMIAPRIRGGVGKHFEEMSTLLKEEGFKVLRLENSRNNSDEVTLTCGDVPLPNLSFTLNDKTLVDYLAELQLRHIHVQHLLNMPDAARDWIVKLSERIGIGYDVTLHDYYYICPQLHLIDHTRQYCREPDSSPNPKKCNDCLTKIGLMENSGPIQSWRANHLDFLSRARKIIAPSLDTKTRMAKYLNRNIDIKPHPEPHRAQAMKLAMNSESTFDVAVIGFLEMQKGLDIIYACARHALETQSPLVFHIFGQTIDDSKFCNLPNVKIMGRYEDRDLPRLLRESKCKIAFYASVWPETFCYALSPALDAGILPIAFDFGSVSDRIKAARFGTLLPLEWMNRPDWINTKLQSLCREQRDKTSFDKPLEIPATYQTLKSNYYDLA